MNITDTKWQYLKLRMAGISMDAKLVAIHFAMYPYVSIRSISHTPPILAVLLPHTGINKRNNK